MAGDETQCTERNGFYSSKLNQFSQIPRYIFNHHIYIKYQISNPLLHGTTKTLGATLFSQCSPMQQPCFIPMPENSQHFSCMPHSKVSLATNYNVTNYSAITDERQYTYEMKSNPQGISIIINNENFKSRVLKSRPGAKIDSQNLWDLFVYLGFDTQYQSNKTHVNVEMRHMLNEVAAMNHIDSW